MWGGSKEARKQGRKEARKEGRKEGRKRNKNHRVLVIRIQKIKNIV
jgi:hypothetical protein